MRQVTGGTRRVAANMALFVTAAWVNFGHGGLAWAQSPAPVDQVQGRASAVGAPAPGQIANGSQVQSNAAIAEVVVTARRRSENVERVPVTVTALGAAQLAERSIHNEQDLQIAVPGLIVRQSENQNNLNFAIRGQSIDATSGSRPAVLPYVDDVQINTASASSFFDLDSVQVLKGPQGTLFGRNATGGAVLYTTAKPTDTFGGFVTARLGDYDLREVQGAVNLPIVNDKVLLRLSGDVVHRDGYVDNIFNNTKLGAVETQAGRASLILRPMDKLQNATVVQYEHDGGNNIGVELYSAYPCGSTNHGIVLASTISCLFSPALDAAVGLPGAFNAYLAAHPNVPAGGLVAFLGEQKALGPWQVDLDSPSFHKSHNFFVANTTTYDVSPDLQVKNIFGAANAVAADASDLDGTPYGITDFHSLTGQTTENVNDTLQASDEFQILGKAFSQKLDYILGAYYAYERDRTLYEYTVLNLSPIIPPSSNATGGKLADYTEALFFQGTYDLGALTGIQGLSFTGGFRYTWEQSHITQDPLSKLYGAPPEKQDVSEPSWQVGVQYQLSHDLLLYVENRGSFRSGGFNLASPAVDTTAAGGGNVFLPETTYDVEVGSKYQGRLFGFPARLNADAFDQWITNAQRTAYTIVNGELASVTANVPSAEVRGYELDGSVSPNRWLDLGANLAYTDAEFTQPMVDLAGSEVTFGPYADAPRYSGSVFAAVHVDLPSNMGKPVFRTDVYAQSSDYFSNLNNTVSPGTKLPGYVLVNLRVDWRNFFGYPVTASAFARNVTDERYFAGGLAIGPGFGINGAAPGQPRMYGAELTYRF